MTVRENQQARAIGDECPTATALFVSSTDESVSIFDVKSRGTPNADR